MRLNFILRDRSGMVRCDLVVTYFFHKNLILIMTKMQITCHLVIFFNNLLLLELRYTIYFYG